MKIEGFSRFWIVTTAILDIFLSGCSLKSKPQVQTLHISLPQASSRSRNVGKTQHSSAGANSPVPLSYSDFTCFAVNVVGSGIGADPRLSCGDPSQGLGVIAGFVPVTAQTISVTVPNGAGRQVQLIGVESTTGCPDLNALLNNQGKNSFQGISDPYLLASATVDVFSNTSVDMTASFDPLHPTILFQGCGGDGPSYSPTTGFTGYYSISASSAGQPVPLPAVAGDPAPAPAPTPNGLDLGGFAVIPSATLASIPISSNNSQPPLSSGMSYANSGTTNFQRAVIQLQWDAAQMNLSKYPYARIQLQMRGGQQDGCATSPSFGAAAAVYDNVDGEWIALSQGSYYSGVLQWSWAGGLIPVPVSKLLVTKSDGKQYIVLNIESNYATNNSSCPSAVYVGQAALQLLPTQGGGNHISSPLWMGSTALMSTGTSGSNYFVQYSTTAHFFVNGGKPPYAFSVAGTGSIDSTGKYTAPASGTSDIITVTDSAGKTQTATVNLAANGAILGANLLLITASPYTASNTTCIELMATTVGFGGTTPNVGGTTTLSLTGFSGSFYSNSSCTTVTTPQILTGNASTPFYYKGLTQAGTIPFNASLQGGSALQAPASLYLPVNAAGFNQIQLFGPASITGGYCGAYSLQAADAYGNSVGSNTAVNVSNLPAGFFSDSGCTAPASTLVSIPANRPNTTVYFQSSSAGAVSLAGVTTTATATTLGGSLTVASASVPVALQLAIDSANPSPGQNSCVLVDVNTVDSFGNAKNYSGTTVTPAIASGAQNNAAYSLQADCLSNTADTLPSITSGISQVQVWVRTDSAQTGSIQATVAGLNPSNLLNTQY